MSTTFDIERFATSRAALGTRLGSPLHALPVTASTNSDALQAARDGAPHGVVFVADEQTQGRGRRGHVWQSKPGDNLLVSVLLRPRFPPHAAAGFALATGLAVRDAVAPLIADVPLVKWPNDVLVNEKKLSGILVESQVLGSTLSALVVGIGLNVQTRLFEAELADRATSLSLLGAETSRETVLAGILYALEQRLNAYESSGVAGITEELRSYDALLGKRIRVDTREGIARGIDAQGRLLLEDLAGECHAILSGSVEFYAA